MVMALIGLRGVRVLVVAKIYARLNPAVCLVRGFEATRGEMVGRWHGLD